MPAEAGTVVLVGGVGLWPGLFECLEHRVGELLRDVVVTSHVRRGYDGRPPSNGMDEIIGDVREVVSAVAPPVTVFGELGGATVALALALDPPPGLGGVVAHEPLLGSHEPELRDLVRVAAKRLVVGGEGAATRFVADLIGGDTWDALPNEARCFAADFSRIVVAEVPHFAAWEPGRLRFRVPFLTTVGRTSAGPRHRAARVMRAAGAHTDMTDGGHLASVDDPEAIAAAVQWAHAA